VLRIKHPCDFQTLPGHGRLFLNKVGIMRAYVRLLVVAVLATVSWLSVAFVTEEVKQQFSEDAANLATGHNILYMSVGNSTFNTATVVALQEALHLNNPVCMSVCGTQNIMQTIRGTSTCADGPSLVVVTDVEYLSPTERRALDFAYRLTDSSCDFAGTVVVLLLDTNEQAADHPPTNRAERDELKLMLAEALNEDSVYLNGHAFTGRLSRVLFQQKTSNITIPARGCATAPRLNVDYCSSQHKVCKESNVLTGPLALFKKYYQQLIDGLPGGEYSIASLAVVLLLAVVWCLRGVQNSDSNHYVAQAAPRSVPAMVVGANSYSSGGSMNYGIAPSAVANRPQEEQHYQHHTTDTTVALPRSPTAEARHERTSGASRRTAGTRPGTGKSIKTRPVSDSHRHTQPDHSSTQSAGKPHRHSTGGSGAGKHSNTSGAEHSALQPQDTTGQGGHEYATRSKDHRD
jgi:hypothetical protein